MANLQIPAPSNDKRPVNVYEWLGLLQKVLKDTKGIEWHLSNTLNIKQLGDSIGNDLNFVRTVDNKIAESHKPKELVANTDLNTLKETGLFSGGFDSNADTITHRPNNLSGSFILRVYTVKKMEDGRPPRLIQVYYDRSTGDSYTRICTEGDIWTDWNRTLKQTDVSVNADPNKLVIRDPNGNIKVNTIVGSLQGNSDSATKLKTPRKINGTNFDGTQDIITNQWGTARNFAIGKTSKSVNGSANMAWTLDEIGALPTAGGTMTGSIRFSGGGYSGPAIQLEAGDANGAYIGIGAGGLTVIGSGESTAAVRTNMDATTETMVISSDQSIVFHAGMQDGYGNRKTVTITNTGVLEAPQGVKGNLTGNASSASKLQTARTIAVTGAINGSGSFDGSANLSITTNRQSIVVGTDTDGLVQWYLVASRVMTGHDDSIVTFSVNSTHIQHEAGILRLHVRSVADGTYDTMSLKWLSNTGLDVNNFAVVYNDTEWKLFAKTTKRYQRLDFTVLSMSSRTQSLTNYVKIPTSITAISDLPTGTVTYSSNQGIVNAANKLVTPRQINGTNFDGTANITTAKWGTARNIQIGLTSKSVDGSGNYSWNLSEIGALPLTGGTLTGKVTSTFNGEAFKLMPASPNLTSIIAFYKDKTNRSAWIGHGSNDHKHFTINTDLPESDIELLPGSGKVKVQGNASTTSVSVGDGKATMQYNNDLECIDFIFA